MRKNPLAQLLCLLFVAGCSTPSDFLEEEASAEFISKNSPRQVAYCIARNSNDYYPGYSGTVHDSGVGKEPIQVITRAGQNLYAVTQITQIENDSIVKVYFGSWTAGIAPKKDGLTVEERLTKGCI